MTPTSVSATHAMRGYESDRMHRAMEATHVTVTWVSLSNSKPNRTSNVACAGGSYTA